CCLVLPKGNNKTLFKLVKKIIHNESKEYEKSSFKTEDDFVKLSSDFRFL
ncbi:hypothetical protein BgiBS90_021003, partial [Biomphalaria glabrata]